MEKTLRLPSCKEQAVLDQVQVRLVERAELENFKQLLDEHHYLGSTSLGWRHLLRERNFAFCVVCDAISPGRAAGGS
jgi:hypothetical protein